MKIGIASDHRGYKLKEQIKNKLNKEFEIIDYGTNNTKSTDYPIYAKQLCKGITNNDIEFGIAICGTGIGMSIICNKIKGIYCAKIDNYNDAKYAKEHNNANVLALNEKISVRKAMKMINIYINTSFSKEKKHTRRINLIKELEK